MLSLCRSLFQMASLGLIFANFVILAQAAGVQQTGKSVGYPVKDGVGELFVISVGGRADASPQTGSGVGTPKGASEMAFANRIMLFSNRRYETRT